MLKIIILSILILGLYGNDLFTKKNLTGLYSLSNDCSSVWCSSTFYTNYDLNSSFGCPNNGNTGSIAYNEDQQYYIYTFEQYATIGSGNHQEIYFDESNIHENENIQIPLEEGYKLIIAPCWDKDGKKIFEKCDKQTQGKQEYVVWKTQDPWEDPNSCSYVLTKYGELLKNNQDEDQIPTNVNYFTYPYSTEQLVGVYDIGDQCKNCEETLINYQQTKEEEKLYSNQYACPRSKSTAEIKYDKQNQLYTLELQRQDPDDNKKTDVLIKFSLLNFYQHNTILIPSVDDSGDQYNLTITPCFLGGLKQSIGCKDDKNLVQLSVERKIDSQNPNIPCYFILSKQNSKKSSHKVSENVRNRFLDLYKNSSLKYTKKQ